MTRALDKSNRRTARRQQPGRVRDVGLLALWVVLPAGCGLITIDPPGGPVDGNRGGVLSSTVGRTSGEPNDDFDVPLVAVFDGADRARLQGAIVEPRDVDVFDLGSLAAGDHIVIDVDTHSLRSALDSMIGLFDADRNLFIENDDRSFSLDSLIDETIRRDSAHYFLVVASSAFADPTGFTGSYRIDIEVLRGGAPPAARGQTVFLDFDGGGVPADNLGVSRVPPFDAAAISPLYAGQDDRIKSAIVASVMENFEGFDLSVFTSDESVRLDPPFSIVFLGGFFPQGLEAFGISESVDRLNSDEEDVSIIFTEAFAPSVFSSPPSAEALGVAIGNIAVHEVGHLLGLNHVEDPTALMDAVSGADVFLEDQEFRRSELYAPELFPIGFQDAVLLLSEIIGVF